MSRCKNGDVSYGKRVLSVSVSVSEGTFLGRSSSLQQPGSLQRGERGALG